MNITLNDFFKFSFIVGLEYQTVNFCKRMSKLKEYGLPKTYDPILIKNSSYKKAGIIKTNNVICCTFCHLSLVKMAKTLNFPYIVIFEYDAIPINNIEKFLQYYISNVPEDTDILKLGSLFDINNVNHLLLSDRFMISDDKRMLYGNHSYVVFKRYYNDFIKNICTDLVSDHYVFLNDNVNIIFPNKNLFLQSENSNSIHNDKRKNLLLTYDRKTLSNDFGLLL